MPGDVVEDVGLRQIVERRAVADGYRGGKFAVSETIEKEEGRNIPAHRLGLEAGERAKKAIHIVQPRHPVGIETEIVDALEESRVGVAAPTIFHAGEQAAPSVVVGCRIELVRLVDVEPALLLGLLDKRSVGGRETAPRRVLRLHSRHAHFLGRHSAAPG
jgi:hypothetical protein